MEVPGWQELRSIHRANGGFHDAEIAAVELQDTEGSLSIVLRDMRKFVGDDAHPEPGAHQITLRFDGVELAGAIDIGLLVEYGVNHFAIEGDRTVCIETALTSLRFSFESVAVSSID